MFLIHATSLGQLLLVCSTTFVILGSMQKEQHPWGHFCCKEEKWDYWQNLWCFWKGVFICDANHRCFYSSARHVTCQTQHSWNWEHIIVLPRRTERFHGNGNTFDHTVPLCAVTDAALVKVLSEYMCNVLSHSCNNFICSLTQETFWSGEPLVLVCSLLLSL